MKNQKEKKKSITLEKRSSLSKKENESLLQIIRKKDLEIENLKQRE
jgi:hypothetical protein